MPRAQHAATATVSARLEAALIRELVVEVRQLNHSYFKDALTPAAIALVYTRHELGRWVPDTRTIELSRPMVLESPWGAVVEVLKHELAHQFVHEVLDLADEVAHGPAFRDVCARLGVDGRAAGMPSAAADSADRDGRMVERIARLLALAESPNVHEAEAAMAAAQKLMLKHNLEVGRAGGARGYSFRQLGKPTGRVTEAERILSMLLGRHFFVEVIWIPTYRVMEQKRGSVLEICGTISNLEIAEYVHGYLLHTAERLWEEHKRALGIRSNRDRRVYLAGVMTGFAEKLGAQTKEHREQGLVWVKDGDLGSYFRRRHPHVRHVRNAGHTKNEAYSQGREAGRRIVLHRSVNARAESRGRLLTGGGS